MEDCTDLLRGAAVLPTLDANSAYWQAEFKNEDEDKKAFTSHNGPFRFLRMAFGFPSAPSNF